MTPFNKKERLMHVAEAKRTLGSKVEWLCDSMENQAKHALGDAPNSEFIIDPKGKIVVSRRWSNPGQLRQDLAKLVGASTKTTSIAELGLKQLPPPKKAQTGVVPRVRLSGRYSPVLSAPVGIDNAKKESTFFAKLRAEADSSLLSQGTGKLYLGFFLDPLYKVHWNNKTEPLRYEIKAPPGVEITPAKGSGPEVKVAADADPREFVVDIVGGRVRGPLEITVHYFACDDAETFCIPVTQKYEVTLQRDRDGGSRRSGGGRGGFAGRGRGGFRPDGSRPSRPSSPREQRAREERGRQLAKAVSQIKKRDKNRDGKLTAEEMANPRLFQRADADKDGLVTLRELLRVISP